MSDTHTHKHWCTDHKSVGEDSCFTEFIVYDNGEEEKTEPEEGSFSAQLKAVGVGLRKLPGLVSLCPRMMKTRSR